MCLIYCVEAAWETYAVNLFGGDKCRDFLLKFLFCHKVLFSTLNILDKL